MDGFIRVPDKNYHLWYTLHPDGVGLMVEIYTNDPPYTFSHTRINYMELGWIDVAPSVKELYVLFDALTKSYKSYVEYQIPTITNLRRIDVVPNDGQ